MSLKRRLGNLSRRSPVRRDPTPRAGPAPVPVDRPEVPGGKALAEKIERLVCILCGGPRAVVGFLVASRGDDDGSPATAYALCRHCNALPDSVARVEAAIVGDTPDAPVQGA
jgi:hypothetical protein